MRLYEKRCVGIQWSTQNRLAKGHSELFSSPYFTGYFLKIKLNCIRRPHHPDVLPVRVRFGFSVRHGVQRRMISVDNFSVFLRLLVFALLLLYVT